MNKIKPGTKVYVVHGCEDLLSAAYIRPPERVIGTVHEVTSTLNLHRLRAGNGVKADTA